MGHVLPSLSGPGCARDRTLVAIPIADILSAGIVDSDDDEDVLEV